LGSLNCGREVASSTSSAITQEHERLSAQYKRADAALIALPNARPTSIVKAEIDILQRDNKIAECTAWLSNVHQRQICIEQISPLQKELATATEHDRLKSELAAVSSAKISLLPSQRIRMLLNYSVTLQPLVHTSPHSSLWI
jgi:hypothetical protein